MRRPAADDTSMDPAHDFLTPRSDASRRPMPADRTPPRRRGPWAALGRGIGFVALLVGVCSPLWGLAVFFMLH
jgi:hypothetical protein